MRLLDPSLGEVYDRMSILAMKIQEGKIHGLATEEFEREFTLVSALMKTIVTGRQVELMMELAAVNALIWQRLHTVRKQPQVPESGRLAVEATLLNDRRIELIARIDQLVSGTEYVMHEGSSYQGKL